MAESTRQLKAASNVQRELADMFLKDKTGLPPGAMVTVTKVRISPDLAVAKVFLSFWQGMKPQEALEFVQAQTPVIRLSLGRRIRKQARIVPELHFFLDDSLDYIDRIDELLKGE